MGCRFRDFQSGVYSDLDLRGCGYSSATDDLHGWLQYKSKYVWQKLQGSLFQSVRASVKP